MAQKRFETALVITGDATDGLKAVRLTKEALEQLEQSGMMANNEVKKLDTNLAKAASEMSGFSAHTDHASGLLGGFKAKVIAAGLAVAGISGYSRSATLGVIDLAKELDITSKQLGVSTDSMQVWSMAGKSLGIEMEKMRDIFKDTSDKLGDFVATGGGEAKDIVEKLGLNVAKLNAMKPDQVLLEIGAALETVQGISQHEKVFLLEALANDASMLLPLLEENGAALEEVRRKAELRGQIISPTDLEMLKEANSKISESKAAIAGLKHQVGLLGAEFMTLGGTGFTEMIDSFSRRLNEFDLTVFAAKVQHEFLVLRESAKVASAYLSTEFQIMLQRLSVRFPETFNVIAGGWERLSTFAASTFAFVVDIATTSHDQMVRVWQREISVSDAFASMTGDIENAYQALIQDSPKVGVALKEVFDGVSSGFDRVSLDVSLLASEAAGAWGTLENELSTKGIASDQESGWAVVESVIDRAISLISNTVEGGWEVIVTSGRIAIRLIQGDFSSAFNLLDGLVSNGIERIKQSFKSLGGDLLPEDLKTMGLDLLSGLGVVAKDVVPFIGKVFSDVGDLAQELRQTIWYHWDDIKAVTSLAWNAISSVVTVAWDTAVGAVTVALRVLRGDFSGAWDVIQSGIDTFVETAKSLLASLLDPLLELPAKAINAGKDVVDGLAKGIESAASQSVDALTHVGKEMWSGFTGFFDIHSPSRLMHQAGVDINTGLANGIHDGSGAVITASEGVASALNDSLLSVTTGAQALGEVSDAAGGATARIAGLRAEYQDFKSASDERIAQSKAMLDALIEQRNAESLVEEGVKLTSAALQSSSQSGESAAAGVKKLSERSKEFHDIQKAGKTLTESLRTPHEVYQAQLARAKVLLAANAISQDTYNRALKDYKKTLDEATEDKGAKAQAESAVALDIARQSLSMNEEELRAYSLTVVEKYLPAVAQSIARNEALGKSFAEGKTLTESLRTPHEVYQAQLARAKVLLAANAISQDTYNRALKDYKKTLDEATEDKGAKAQAESAVALDIARQSLSMNEEELRAYSLTVVEKYLPAVARSIARNEALGKSFADGKTLTESLRTPHEVYQAQLARANVLLAANAISQETYNRALKEYKKTLDEDTGDQKYLDLMKKLNQEQSLLVIELTEGAKAANDAALEMEGYDEKQRQSIQSTKDNIAAMQSLKETAKDIGNTLVDGLLSGDWKSAGDSLVSIFKDQILKPILTKAIEPFQTDLVQALSGEGGVSVLTQSGGLFSTSRLSQSSGNQPSTRASSFLGQSSGMGGRYGRMFSNGLMGAGVGAGISSILGGDSKYGAIGGAIGSLFGGWGSVIGGALGGFAEKIFGGKKETTDTGLALAYGAGGFTGQKYEDWKKDGGWFRSDKSGTNYTAIDSDITGTMDAYFDEVESGLIQQAEYFGYDSAQSVIDGFSTGLVKLSGTDDMEARVNAWAAEVREQLYTGVFATDFDALSQDGESLADTLDRLILEIGVVETAVTGLGLSFGLSGIEVAKAADNIAQAVGGVANLATLTDTYYANFYSDTERLQSIVDDSMASIAVFNSAQGTSVQGKEDLRAYVEALDLTSESGQLAFASAMELVPALVALSDAQDELGTSTDALLSQALGLRDAMRSIETGNLSTLAPVEQLELVRDDFSATYQSALAGDQDALSAITGEAQALLQLSQAYNASGAGYQADYSTVMTALDALATRFEDQIKLDGSHAAGLAYVPHDGYRAELHQGESVIDARTMFGLKKYGIPVNQGSAGQPNAELLSELKALRSEVAQLRKERQQAASRSSAQRNTQIEIAADTQQQLSVNQRAANRQQRFNMK